MIRPGDVDALRCVACGGALRLASGGADSGGRVDGTLGCVGCGAAWPVRNGLPRLVVEHDVRGPDRLMRAMYDVFGAWHDPAVTWLLPLFEGTSEQHLRDGYVRRVELGTLTPRPDGRPLRVLETGIGAGADLAWLRRDLPPGLPVEIWGLDLSEGMLAQCARRLRREGSRDVRLVLADAHALPFADASFDRVLHVGGIGGFRDPGLALAEMARVSVPGAPIVVVDEQLATDRPQRLFHRAGWKLLTFYNADSRCPRELVPPGAVDVRDEQISRYYYCLTFRMPAQS